MKLNMLISQHQTGDPDTTTEAVFDAVGLPPKWRKLFYPLVWNECRRMYRAVVRDIEHVSSVEGGPSPVVEEFEAIAGREPVSRRDFLDAHFYTGSVYVTWAKATVQDHRDRIAYLNKLRNGIRRSVGKHAEAIEVITKAGVSCLAELDESEAA